MKRRFRLRPSPVRRGGLLIFGLLLLGLYLLSRVAPDSLRLPTPRQGREAPAATQDWHLQGSWPATLDHVVDGDSFHVRDSTGQRVEIRLVGINAAEMDSPQGAPQRSYNLSQLESASFIRIEPEPSGPMDKHGRVLAWVWLDIPGASAPQLLNENLVKYAGIPLFKHADARMKHYSRLQDAAAYARLQGEQLVMH